MTVGTPLHNKLIKTLEGTRRRLSEVCEDLGIDYDELLSSGDIGIDTCSHCNMWTVRLVPDLDGNPICNYCLQISGM